MGFSLLEAARKQSAPTNAMCREAEQRQAEEAKKLRGKVPQSTEVGHGRRQEGGGGRKVPLNGRWSDYSRLAKKSLCEMPKRRKAQRPTITWTICQAEKPIMPSIFMEQGGEGRETL